MRKKRTDKNQSGIVSEMRQLQIQVIISNFGDDFPDLVCGWAGNWILLEVKQPDGSIDRGQLRFLADARGFVAVVCDSDSAIRAVTDPNEYCVSNSQQDRIAKWLLRNPSQETLSVRKYQDLIAEID